MYASPIVSTYVHEEYEKKKLSHFVLFHLVDVVVFYDGIKASVKLVEKLDNLQLIFNENKFLLLDLTSRGELET